MTKLEEFTKAAMTGLISHYGSLDKETLAKNSVSIAVATLKAISHQENMQAQECASRQPRQDFYNKQIYEFNELWNIK
jgi:hypothetical protein